MKKLFWSAYVVSLILWGGDSYAQTESIDDFLGLESEVLPELKGKQRFTQDSFNQVESWNIDPEKVQIDLPEPNKGQKYSIIPWSTLDPIEWLSVDKWIINRKIKDKTPDWKIRLRESDKKELVGKILQCAGTCFNYRGIEKAHIQHLSRVREGDEVVTEKNSVAWIYLMDGSLMRLGPESSLSLQEINFGKKETFILARLNQGHLFYEAPSKTALKLDDSPETDSLSVPLLVKEANQEFYERKIYQEQKDAERLGEVLFLSDNAIKNQFEEINSLKVKNSSKEFPSKVMVVAPSATLVGEDTSFDMVYVPGGQAYFKNRRHEEGKLRVLLRGYTYTDPIEVGHGSWNEVAKNGRSQTIMEDVPGSLQVLELLTKRIRTIELAREIWMNKFSLPIFASLDNPEVLGKEYGYTLWGEELEKRQEFLVEYTRRIETTNLRSMENLLTKLELEGEKIRREVSDDLYRASLNDYLFGLKTRYDKKNMRTRELNNLQYYVWILRNGKF